jgi:hypothetical protein
LGTPITPELRSSFLSSSSCSILFDGYYSLIRDLTAKQPKETRVTSDLQRLHFPTSFITDFLKRFDPHRSSLQSSALDSLLSLPSFTSLQWRLDVSISTNSLARVFKPSILFQITLNNGEIRQFECSTEKFQDLRYQIAKAMRKVQEIQQHPTLMREAE